MVVVDLVRVSPLTITNIELMGFGRGGEHHAERGSISASDPEPSTGVDGLAAAPKGN